MTWNQKEAVSTCGLIAFVLFCVFAVLWVIMFDTKTQLCQAQGAERAHLDIFFNESCVWGEK